VHASTSWRVIGRSRCKCLMVGSDVTQRWHHRLIEHSMVRVYGDVDQGGIKSDLFCPDSSGGACHLRKTGAIGMGWLACIRQLQLRCNGNRRRGRRFPHPPINKPPQVTLKPPAPSHVRVADAPSTGIMTKTEKIDPVWDDLDR
jgi:hypothetical protein